MTEHDGLTAEQEAGRVWSTKRDQIIFVRGANWATEREKARAEAAGALVKAMLRAFDYWNATRGHDDESDERTFRAFLATLAPLRALTTPTTEAVTDVEGR